MTNITKEDFEKILWAYGDIESPCHYCPFRNDHFCNIYKTQIVEDSPDVFFPCSECENSVLDFI